MLKRSRILVLSLYFIVLFGVFKKLGKFCRPPLANFRNIHEVKF